MDRVALFAGICATLTVASAEAGIVLDVDAKPIKDQRNSSCAPDLGYAGTLMEGSFHNGVAEWFYVSNRVETARLFREAGVRFIRQWSANERWQLGLAWARAKDRAAMAKRYKKSALVDPRECFSFWKENDVKVLLTLENYGVYTDVEAGKSTNDLETVKKVICDYVRWIIDNGYKGCVAGFEMGNEPYFGKDPEKYGARWSAIVPEIKRIWPEAQIGLPVAEYRSGDPDIAAVRARATGLDWVTDGKKGRFKISRLNQWSGRFIVAMSNQLHNVSHVIYHFYGGDAAYGCSACGFGRIAKFAKVFPEIADKRVWISEWRERSDEDLTCHQVFFSSLWKGHYLLAVLGQPNVDGVNLHNLGTLSGGLYVSNGKNWISQRDGSKKICLDKTGIGIPHAEVGPAGPVFRLYCSALLKHPIILEHGVNESQGAGAHFWASAVYYESGRKQAASFEKGVERKDWPKIRGNVEWIAAMSPEKDSLALLMVNTKPETVVLPVEIEGRQIEGRPVIRTLRCESDGVYAHVLPGEKPLWKLTRADGASTDGGKLSVTLEPNVVQTVVVRMK